MNLINDFTQDLFRHLTQSDSVFKGGIIKKHTENFDTHGEFSLPLDIKPWKHYLKLEKGEETKYQSIFDFTYSSESPDCENGKCLQLIEDSKLWTLKVEKCQVIDKRLYIFLDRTHAIKQYLCNQQNYENFSTLCEENSKVFITHDEHSSEDLSSCRLKHLVDVSKNLLHICGYSVISDYESSDVKLHFTIKAANKSSKECINVFSAPVLNEKTGSKETGISSAEYLSKRIMDMQLIAQHKYGLRVKNESQWKAFLEQIGQAAVIFDLLQNKPSHPVSISSVDSASGSSKGAAFVLYNSARLATMIRKYNEHVESGLYPKLSHVENVDFSIINDNDEWILMFNFMMGYTSLLKKCVNLSSKDCPIAPHQLCTFLSGLAGRFSMYYRRIRILLEPRKHLLPFVEARIHFILALQNIVHHALHILNIKPVTQM